MIAHPQFIGVQSAPSDEHTVCGPARYYDVVQSLIIPVEESVVDVEVANPLAFPVGMSVFVTDNESSAFLMVTDVDSIAGTIELENYGSIYNADSGTTLSGAVYIVLVGPKIQDVVR